MKILVLSDSHHDLTYMRRAIALERPNLIFHLGDHIRDAEDLSMAFPTILIMITFFSTFVRKKRKK